MSLSAVNAAPLQAVQLQPALQATLGGDVGKMAASAVAADNPQNNHAVAPVPETSSELVASERISLSSTTAADTERLAQARAAPVYAEVWKGSVKVAVIDSRGNVVSSNGLLAPTAMGGGGGGPELAARRAAQIARTVGGEIRVAGQLMDVSTLNTRAKLQAAYSVSLS
jgi:hypothetical protein